jgi:hypothetical protein
MKLRAMVVLLAVAAATPEIQYFRYERGLAAPAAKTGQTCMSLDAGLFAHAAPGLADLRLYRGTTETPYVVREAMPVEQQQPRIEPLNLGSRSGQTVFDAKMPEGQYSDVELDVAGTDFIATVRVTGSQKQSSAGTKLGSYTIFDLTGQKLGRSTVLHLPESDFRYLHFAIVGKVKPDDVAGLSVERVSAKQTYVTVADTNHATLTGHTTTIQFKVPANVPVERIAFVAGAEPANFSRDVTIKVEPMAKPTTTDTELPQPAVASGNLLRVHGTHDGQRIDEERLTVDAPSVDFGAPGSLWTVSIDNGDDAPLALTDARLEMAERKLCFDATDAASYALYYGDPALSAPRYDYGTLFVADADAAQATLAPEGNNPQFQARPDTRAFTERHPALLWIALFAVVVVLGAVAFRTAKESKPE